MKTLTNLFLLTAASIFLLTNCETDESSEKQFSLKSDIISNSGCKNLKSANETDYTPDSLSCINYSFDSQTNRLTLQHINAGFNCCPDSLFCDATLKNNMIIIQEFETGGFCNCDCLYDLEIELNEIDSKKYQVKFIEPYAAEYKEILFEMDLRNTSEGTYCVTREQYPWGIQ